MFKTIAPFRGKKYTIQMSYELMSRIKEIVRRSPIEAQWFHTVKKISTPQECIYHLENLIIPEQICQAAQVESTPMQMYSLYKELQKQVSPEKLNEVSKKMTCWCHSHHEMSPLPSGQDNKQFTSFCKNEAQSAEQNTWVMLIFNKRSEFFSRVYDWEEDLLLENLDIRLTEPDYTELHKEIKEKFKKPAPKKKTLWPQSRISSEQRTREALGLQKTMGDFVPKQTKSPIQRTTALEYISNSTIVKQNTKSDILTIPEQKKRRKFCDELQSRLDEDELNNFLTLIIEVEGICEDLVGVHVFFENHETPYSSFQASALLNQILELGINIKYLKNSIYIAQQIDKNEEEMIELGLKWLKMCQPALYEEHNESIKRSLELQEYGVLEEECERLKEYDNFFDQTVYEYLKK